MNNRRKPSDSPQQTKKPYAQPQLIEYGSIEKLTQTGSLVLGDAAMMMMACL